MPLRGREDTMRDRFRQLFTDYREDTLLALSVALIAFTAFGIGRATAPRPQKAAPIVEALPLTANAGTNLFQGNPDAVIGTTNGPGAFVASKNGTKYYLPTCSGANRIKKENRIWFTSIEEAKSQGYTPAANCPGLTVQ